MESTGTQLLAPTELEERDTCTRPLVFERYVLD